MAYWPLNAGATKGETGTLSGSNVPLVNVVASATPHAKGSWVTLLAATATNWDGGFYIIRNNVSFTGATDTSTLMDIGIGAAASEIVVLSDFAVGYKSVQAGTTTATETTYIPIRIPAGARIAARSQSAVVSKSVSVGVAGQYGVSLIGNAVPQRSTTYGTTSATSCGTTVTGSASSNTYGSWAQVTASTTAPIHGLMVSIQGASSTNMASRYVTLKLGIGGAGSEQQIGPVMFFVASSNEWVMNDTLMGGYIPVMGLSIPVGSRISAAVQGSTAVAEPYDVSVHAFTY